MPLPTISAPLFTLEIPSTGVKVKYRPFQVREEKILLIAQENGDREQMVLAIKQVLNNCLFEVDIDTLTLFDIQWCLMHIRAASVDNILNFRIKDVDTDEIIDLSIDVSDIQLTKDPEHTNRIKANDDYTIIMRYPTLEETFRILHVVQEAARLKNFIGTSNNKEAIEKAKEELKKLTSQQVEYDIMISCLESVVSDDQVFKFADASPDEVAVFMDSLDVKVIPKIQAFFETMPSIQHEVKYKNSNGDEKIFTLNGLEGFFT